MPGMWELPQAARNRGHIDFRVRHSITNTDYEVLARMVSSSPRRPRGKWIPISRLPRLALTGLARKLLRMALPEIANQLK
jgi:hypothetical protein